jgi:hypothetical protein
MTYTLEKKSSILLYDWIATMLLCVWTPVCRDGLALCEAHDDPTHISTTNCVPTTAQRYRLFALAVGIRCRRRMA